MVTNTAKLQEKIMALTNIDGSGGVDILTKSGDFKSTYDILLGISKVWEKMGDVEQAALLEIVAGKTRGSVVASLFQNGDILEDAYSSALNASGSAMNELNNHLDSIQGRVDLFNNALQTFWMNLINTDVVKFVVDSGTTLVNFADTFIGKLTAIAAIFTIYKKFTSKLSFAEMFNGMVKSTKDAYSSIQRMITATQSLTKADIARTLASKGVKNGLVQQIIAESGLKGATSALTIEQIKATSATLSAKFATGELTAAQYLATMSTMGLKTAVQALWNILKANPVYVVAAAISIAALAFDHFNTTAQEAADIAKEAFDEIQSVVESTKSTIQSLESELSTIQNKIDEFDGKKLSFTEEQDLEKLKKQRKELEHSLRVQQQLLELQHDSSNKQAIASMKAYTKASSEGAKETQSGWKKALTTIGAIVGTIGGAVLTGGASLGVQIGAAVAGGIGLGIAGNKAGEAIGSSIAENEGTYDSWYETYTKALEAARKDEQDALEKYKKDSSSIDKLDKWQEAQQRTSEIEKEMYAHLSQMQQYYNDLEYGADEEINKELDTWYNFLDKFSIEQGASSAEVTALDRIFGEHASEEIKELEEQILEAVDAGKEFDFSSAINGSQELKKTLDYVGLSAEDVKNYFTQIGEATKNPEFDITTYSKDISSHSAVISEFQEALQKLEKGSFTMDDFLDLIERFPDLAKGVDISSNAFYGLSRNLNKAIKSRTKSFVNDLKELKKSLVDAGKSTDSIDQLIEAIENMPDDALDDTIEKYGTLADEMDRAKLANDRLLASMEENPNEGYETRGEALDFIKDKLSRGEAGSESEVWDVAKEYGYIYDHTKSLNENADAMARWAAARETWFKKDDDGNYLFEGTENFIKAVDDAVDKIPELQQLLTWDYDENTGILNFDLDNSNLPEIISLLSKTQEFAHLTAEEWSDMMIQIGQYYDINWSNFDDILDELGKIANGASNAKTKIEEYGEAMQEYFGKGDVDLTSRPEITKEEMKKAGWTDFEDDYATVYSSTYNKSEFMNLAEGEVDTAIVLTPILPDKTVLSPERLKEYAGKILKGEEIDVEGITLGIFDNPKELSGFEEALHKAQEEYHTLMDSYNISATIDKSGLQGLREIKDLQDAIQARSDGTVVINEDAFRTVLTEAGYTENKIDSLIDKIKTLDDEAFNIDPLKIDEAMLSKGIAGLKEIESLQSAIKDDSKTGLTVVDTDAFRTILDNAGYAKDNIDELIKKIQEYNGVVSTSGNTDPLGLNSANSNINTLKASLSTLGVSFTESIGAWFDGSKEIKINVPDLVTTLKGKGWNEESIRNYCTQLSNTNIEGFKVIVNQTELDEALAKSNEIPETENTTYTVDGTGLQTLKNINNEIAKTPRSFSTTHTTYEKTVKQTVTEESSGNKPGGFLSKLFGGVVDGTAHVQGTAYNSGSWGAQKTETSLVGELGPELLVRGNRWTTVGENGAEFTQVKKGDIIFNHKQTKSLLENGYVTSRGRAYAGGTAYASGGGTFGRYEFSGSGGYTKYDVNNNVVDKFGNAASSLSSAADDLSDAADEFEETFDWVEVRLEEINEQLDLLNAQLENAVGYVAKNQIIDTTLGVNNTKLTNLKAGMAEYERYTSQLLAKVPSQYRDAVQNGAIAITEFTGDANEETVEAINNYREWAQKVADLKQQIEELETEITELAKQKFDNVSDQYDNIVGVIENANEKLDAQISLMEDRGYVAAKQYYESMMVNTKEQAKELEKEKVALQQVLDEQVKLGNIKVGSDVWYEMIEQLYEVDAAIVECTSDLESYQNAINDIYWDNFDELINRIDYLKDETQNLIDLMDSDDLVVTPETEDGWSADAVEWTEEGIASLGLYAQQMEIAEYRAKQYEKAIDDLNKDYIAGKYSESEYLEKLNELTSAQYDSIEAYYDAQDAIKDLNKTRVDSIKEGIEKEVEAYEELINKKKEALDADKEAHDFKKTVAEQTKEISDIERQIAALSADNSASARAQRAKLQAELAKAQADLEETYYEQSITDQQNALDKELESFQKGKDEEVAKWEKYLEDVEKVLTDSLNLVQENASGIYGTLSDKANEYGLTLSDSIMSPWQDGVLAISDYQKVFDTAMSSTTEQLKALKIEWQDIINQMAKAAGQEIITQKKENNDYTSTAPKNNTSTSTSNKTITTQPTIKVGGKINASGAKIYSYAGDTSGDNQYFSNDPIYKVLKIDGDWVQVRHHKLSTGVTGWFKKSQVKAYANGTTGIKENQLALIDELGEELVMHAGKNGKLSFMTKGTSVIPHDITENLMQLGELNPQDVLDRNRPIVNAPHITNNETVINIEYGDILHIDNFSGDKPADLSKMIDKAFEKHMKQLNNEIRKFVR